MINRTQEDIIKKWPKDWKEPLASIRCITYNQEPYIAQALDSFLAQETDFPFEIVVHDDASTDKTADIIRQYVVKYPQIIKPIYETENQYSKQDGSLRKIVNKACVGKYIAFCEGDDFWVVPQKLQKQVDFLEHNPEYGMCYTDFNVYDQINNKFQYSCFLNQPSKYPTDYDIQTWIIKTGYVAPMTWVVRKDLWEDACKNAVKSPDGSYALFAYFLAHSKVHCLKKDTTATYRRIQESASHSKSLKKIFERRKGLNKTQLVLAQEYLNKKDFDDAEKIINKKHYANNLKLYVYIGDRSGIDESKKWIPLKKSARYLYMISKSRILTCIYRFFYKMCYNLKK